jgi:hypothetical protein
MFATFTIGIKINVSKSAVVNGPHCAIVLKFETTFMDHEVKFVTPKYLSDSIFL